MLDDIEAVQPSEDDSLEVKAEKYLIEEQKKATEQGSKANQAIEDAIIARHQATGRKFRTRAENLTDAMEWNARVETEKREKVEGAINKAIVDTEKERAERKAKLNQPTDTAIQPPRPNFVQRTIGLVKGFIGRK